MGAPLPAKGAAARLGLKLPGDHQTLLGTRRRAAYVQTVLTGYAYTTVAIAVNLGLIPILVGGLGKAGYGIWLTTAALVQWGAVVTGWLSPGFVKRIGEHLAKGEPDLAANAVANARRLYRTGGLVVVTLGLTLAAWSDIWFLDGGPTGEVRSTILIATAWLALQIEGQIEIAILNAAQRLYVVNVIQAGVLLMSGIAAGLLVLLGFGLTAVAASFAGAAAVGLALYKVSRQRHVALAKATSPFRPAMVREIFSTTAPYALSVAGWLLLSSDIILLALLTSPEVVATYGIAYKVVETLIQVIWRVSDSTQAYIVELNALGEWDGLRRLYHRTNEATLMLGGCLAAAFFFLGDRFLAVWVGVEQSADISIIRLLSIYAVLVAFIHASVIFPFSAARMGRIGALLVLEGLAKVAVAVILVEAVGSPGVVLASILVIVAFSGWYVPWFTTRWLEINRWHFSVQMAKRALPLPVMTAVGAWTASEVVAHGSSPAPVAAAAAIAFGGVAVGAIATLMLRSRMG